MLTKSKTTNIDMKQPRLRCNATGAVLVTNPVQRNYDMAIIPNPPEDINENGPLIQAYNNGFQPIPIIPRDARLSQSTSVGVNSRGKVPGIIISDGTWVGLSGWTKGEITETRIATWGDTVEAGAGVGIRTGEVLGVDIDVTDENLSIGIGDIALDILGGAPCRIGNPPKRLLPYRTDVPRKKSRIEFHHSGTGTIQVVELLGTGQQFVVHGIHPKTGSPYEWSGGNPCDDLRLDDLTTVTDEQIEAFIDAVETVMLKANYQVSEVASRSGSQHRKPIGDPTLVGDPEDVLKALNIIGNTEPNYDKWFRIVVAVKAALSGIEDHYSIYEDWALAWKDNTPDVVRAKWDSITDAEIGIAYLLSVAKRAADHCDDAESSRYFEETIQNHRDQMLSDAFSVITGTADSHITKDSSLPSIILSPPGLVGEIAAYHDSRSYRHAPIYGVAAGLACVSALSAGQFALEMPSGPVSTNLYTLILGATGSGKEMPRTVLKEVLKLVKYDECETSAASEPALLKRLVKKRNAVWTPDEFGRWLKFAGTSSGGHQYGLMSQVMKLYGLAFSQTEPRDYADTKQNIPAIDRPYLSVMATSTSESVTNAMSSEEVVGGALNRMVVIVNDDNAPPFRDEESGVMSKKLREALNDLSQDGIYHRQVRAEMDGKHSPKMTSGYYPIKPEPEAITALRNYRDEADNNRAKANSSAAHLWSRSYENALRVAGCIALGDSDPTSPMLTVANAEWAITFMRWSTSCSLNLLGHIADSQTERDAKKIVNFVIDCVSGKVQSTFTAYNDAGWVPISQITRQFQRIPKWQRDQLISSLIGGGYLKQSKISIAGHGPDAVVYRPFLMDFG